MEGQLWWYIWIKHNATYDTAYAHMSRIAPYMQPVAGPRAVIDMGSTGRSTGAHLHYEIC